MHELRDDSGSLDEFYAEDASVHIERADNDSYEISVDLREGQRLQIILKSKHIIEAHYEWV